MIGRRELLTVTLDPADLVGRRTAALPTARQAS
jgi:hypothetical protein